MRTESGLHEEVDWPTAELECDLLPDGRLFRRAHARVMTTVWIDDNGDT